MTTHAVPADDFLDLMCELTEGRLSSPQTARLEELLRSDPARRQQYVDFMLLVGGLHRLRGAGPLPASGAFVEDLDESGCEPPIIVDSSPTPSVVPMFGGWLVSYVAATLIVGVAILGAWMHTVSQGGGPDGAPANLAVTKPPVPRAEEPNPACVGWITGMVNCFGKDIPANTHDASAPVPRGHTYTLDSGLMEIAYDSGARVVLQGPCVYQVDSDRGGLLSFGKLTARVEKSEIRNPKSERHSPLSPRRGSSPLSPARSSSPLSPLPSPLFVVRTPTAVITDLGTEFGVEVDSRGTTRSCVFAGTVEVQPRKPRSQGADSEDLGSPIPLVAGQSLCVAKNADGRGLATTRGEADPAMFPARPGRLAEFAGQDRLKSFHRWQAYSQRLRKDPALVAYYTFETRGRDPTRDMSILPNVAATGESLDGRIQGPRWTAGRFPGKLALSFSGSGYRDHVELPDPQRFDFPGPFTVAAWSRSEMAGDCSGHLACKGNQWRLLVASKGDWTSFFVAGDVGNNPRTPSPNIVGWHLPTERTWWRLVVGVFEPTDKATATLRLYIDGQLVDERNRVARLTALGDETPVWIGDDAAWATQGEFTGLIDEVAIFSRVLSSKEVREMYLAGRPAMVDQPAPPPVIRPPSRWPKPANRS
ncbi:MAG: LamG-like jellyroll fold domain-containing protein [Thermoguttaceae bacterium]